MKIFGDYLRRHLGGIGIFLACCGIFVLVFSLYDLPAEAVLYGGVLSAVLYLFWFLMHFRKYYQKCRTLRQMQQEIVITTQYLPSPEDVSEQAYQELVELLYQKQQELTQEWQVRYSDMMEYYTAWTHQMKTPIAAMRLHLQAADTPENHILLEDLQRIEQYVEMVLCYLRLDSDSTDYLFVRCDLDSVVRQAVRRFSSQFIHRKIRLEYEPLGCRVLTDEKWLLFVLEQVLSNALKYTRTGGIEIWLEDERGNRVSENPNLKQNTAPGICNTAPATLVIADSGIGIQPEDLPRIFEKGYTGVNGREDNRATGIGLYLSRKILRKLGHEITVDSQVDKGTEVRMSLWKKDLEMY